MKPDGNSSKSDEKEGRKKKGKTGTGKEGVKEYGRNKGTSSEKKRRAE